MAAQFALKVIEVAAQRWQTPQEMRTGADGQPVEGAADAVEWQTPQEPQEVLTRAEVSRPRWSRQLVAFAARRRLDDAYFWMFVALTIMCVELDRIDKPSLRDDFRGLFSTLRADGGSIAALTLFLATVYVGFTWMEPGGIFSPGLIASRWDNHPVARGFAIAIQWLEGIACHLPAIFVVAVLATRGVRMVDHNPANATQAALLTAWWQMPVRRFAVYFGISQILTGGSLPYDELIAVSGAVIVYAGPFLILYMTARRRWQRE